MNARVALRATIAAAGFLALSFSAQAADKTLTVWDFKSSEPLLKPYFDYVRDTFEKAHPGVKIKQIAQPADSYYTVLGTAINAKQGPDVALLHGGNLGLDRADAFVPLKEQVSDILPDLAGLPAFQRKDNAYVALPITVQGVVYYYNREVYKKAGLDPSKPPLTWDEFAANCEAIKSKTQASCVTFGNKDGTDFINVIAGIGEGLWSSGDSRQVYCPRSCVDER